jgi:hypothetical protein
MKLKRARIFNHNGCLRIEPGYSHEDITIKFFFDDSMTVEGYRVHYSYYYKNEIVYIQPDILRKYNPSIKVKKVRDWLLFIPIGLNSRILEEGLYKLSDTRTKEVFHSTNWYFNEDELRSFII